MKRNLACSLVLLFGLSLLAAQAEEWNKTYAVSGKPQVRLDLQDGNIHLVSGPGKEVRATVLTRGWKIGFDDVRILEHQAGDSIEIQVRVPRGRLNLGDRYVKVELVVPAESDLDLHSGDGNITAGDVRGDIRLSTGDGNIDGHSLGGRLAARTGDGNLRLSGRLDHLEAQTGDGNIEVESDSGSKLASDWSLRTGDGNITLRFSGDLSADLDAHTGDGKVRVDFPVTMSGELKENTVRGKINGGGPSLMLRSGDGDIRIEKF